MSKTEIEYCNNCRTDTPHRIRHRVSKDGKKGYTGYREYKWCLTCGQKPDKAQKAKTAKHISLHG